MPLINGVAVSVETILRVGRVRRVKADKLPAGGKRFVELHRTGIAHRMEFSSAVLRHAVDKGQVSGEEFIDHHGLARQLALNVAFRDNAAGGIGVRLVGNERNLLAGAEIGK